MQDLEKLLKKNLALTEENNRLLKKMRRGAVWGFIFKLIWIAVLIGIPVYLYINFLSPVVDEISGVVQKVEETTGKVENLQGEVESRLGESSLTDLLDNLNFFNGGGE